ncbi:unnamed protein product [Hanseniaspora opuntiae]
MVKKRQSVSARKPSIIEEHQNIKISIKQLNDKFEALDYEDVFESESDLEVDDNYSISTCDQYNTIFLKEKDDELTIEELFETNEYGIYKRNFDKDQQIIKVIQSCHDDIITQSNIIQVYLKASKKMLTTVNEPLPLKTFNRIIIFYGLTRSSYEFLPWEKCADFDDLMTKNNLGLDFDRLEFDSSKNKLMFKKDMTKGEFLTLGKTVNVRRLEDISLMEMGLRCGHCNSHLKLRNVSLKVKGTNKEFKGSEETNLEMVKCVECAVCYCDEHCREKDKATHKELYHPSLKYKPNKPLDGKKFKTLLNFLLSRNMETVYTLLTSKTELLSYPVFEVNYANVAILHENNHDDLFKAFELYKNVFYPLCDEYTYTKFLMELGARYLLNVVVDLKNHNPTLNDDHLLSPMLMFLEHTSSDDNVELNMKENKLVLKQSVKKGEAVKFNLYKSIQRHFSNVETQCSEYTLMKSHLGINIKDNDTVKFHNSRRKSSVRFLDKVTAFNIN